MTPFNVIDVENSEVVIDAPASSVKPGMQLVVYKKGKAIRNRRTGKVTSKQTKVAVIGVVTIGEDSVTCKLLEGKITPDEDADDGDEYLKYIVRIPEVPVAPLPSATPVVTPVNNAANPF